MQIRLHPLLIRLQGVAEGCLDARLPSNLEEKNEKSCLKGIIWRFLLSISLPEPCAGECIYMLTNQNRCVCRLLWCYFKKAFWCFKARQHTSNLRGLSSSVREAIFVCNFLPNYVILLKAPRPFQTELTGAYHVGHSGTPANRIISVLWFTYCSNAVLAIKQYLDCIASTV
jgi:hypothetical protein